jgi:uncharacterized protein (TIGR04222 family)
MDVIFENPLARMYGPMFLFLYVMLFVGAFLYIWFVLPIKLSESKEEQNPKIPDNPDPYEIIVISQTENDLIALVIFNLVRRGFFAFELRNGMYYIKKKKEDNIHLLNELEKDVYKQLNKDSLLQGFVRDLNRSTTFKGHAEEIRKKLELEGLIWGSMERRDFELYRMLILIGILALGLYKIIAAVHHNHTNIMGIIFFSVIGCVVVMKLKVQNMPTAKGKKFMENLKLAFRPVYGNGLLKQPGYIEQTLLAVYGFALLNHSTYSNFYNHVIGELKPQSSVYFDSGSGGGCSSSGCGSSCGGGCGGCGGCS